MVRSFTDFATSSSERDPGCYDVTNDSIQNRMLRRRTAYLQLIM